jgi:Bifunctional DNA primase/polymerase, N-terminal
MPPTEPALPIALWYARAGIPVLPVFEPDDHGGCSCGDADCHSPGKHPRNRGGLTNATTDPVVLATWWRRWPTANIGGRTGVTFDACDIDGPDGEVAVSRLLGACHGKAPLVRTGKGGWHLWFQPTGLGNRTDFLPSTDWRGIAGYVLLPPSRHVSGHHYTFARHPTGPLPPVPPPLLQALTPAPAVPARRSPHPPMARPTGYGPAALTREADRVATAPPGTRNDTLNRAAFNLGQLIPTGHITETDATTTLTDAARQAGLPEAEAARTIASGLTAGQRNPRPIRAKAA